VSNVNAPAWLSDALTFRWWAAQHKARLAYADWVQSPGPHEYAAYRAAQDQADTVQDELTRRHVERASH
jgi:hypothetical protein